MQTPGDTTRDQPLRQDRVNTDGGTAVDGDKAADSLSEGGHGEGKPFQSAQKEREDELHDEALEESFPASDPPSAKHIT